MLKSSRSKRSTQPSPVTPNVKRPELPSSSPEQKSAKRRFYDIIPPIEDKIASSSMNDSTPINGPSFSGLGTSMSSIPTELLKELLENFRNNAAAPLNAPASANIAPRPNFRVPPGMPMFRGTSPEAMNGATSFIARFERVLRGSLVPEANFRGILGAHMALESDIDWLEGALNKDDTWLDVRETFLAHFGGPLVQSQYENELHNLTYTLGEPLQTHCDKFSSLVVNAAMVPNPIAGELGHRNLLRIFRHSIRTYPRLKDSITLYEANVNRFTTIGQLITQALTADAAFLRADEAERSEFTSLYASGSSGASHKSDTPFSASNSPSPSRKFCSSCSRRLDRKVTSHNDDQCRSTRKIDSSTDSSSSSSGSGTTPGASPTPHVRFDTRKKGK